ncbi:MAG: hypothetical protein ACRERD_04850 [Candidatus Binatia bacterium]
MTTAILSTTGFAFTPWADHALSGEAQVLRGLIGEAAQFSESIAVGEPKRTAQEALYAAYAAAQAEDWNDEGSVRVEPSAYIYASQFLRLLPSTIPIPEISADRDGEILCEWDFGRRRVFSVSVGKDGTLTYAALIGYTKTHGTEHLREALPVVIADCLARLGASSKH